MEIDAMKLELHPGTVKCRRRSRQAARLSGLTLYATRADRLDKTPLALSLSISTLAPNSLPRNISEVKTRLVPSACLYPLPAIGAAAENSLENLQDSGRTGRVSPSFARECHRDGRVERAAENSIKHRWVPGVRGGRAARYTA